MMLYHTRKIFTRYRETSGDDVGSWQGCRMPKVNAAFRVAKGGVYEANDGIYDWHKWQMAIKSDVFGTF